MQSFLNPLSITMMAFLFLFSCKKEPEEVPLMEKSIGQYQVHKKISSEGFSGCGETFIIEKDTIISVNYGIKDSTLIVLNREIILDANGYYYAFHYMLRIWEDSIWSYHVNIYNNCGHYEEIKGIKTSNKPLQ